MIKWFLAVSFSLYALPELDRVALGDPLSFRPEGQHLEVTLGRSRTALDWKSFSIAGDETVRFTLPSAASAVLNRVTGKAPSEIFGRLESNGTVYLINPQGIVFGRGSVVDVGSLIASTHPVSTEDFLEQRELLFCSDSEASIVNLGTLQTRSGSLVLMAAKIVNEGTLSASLHQVALATGQKIRLRFQEYPLLSIEVGGSGGMEHTGVISAKAVQLRAESNPGSLGICLKGVVEANRIENEGGEIYLRAKGPVEIAETAHLSAREGRISLAVHSQRALMQKGTLDVSGERGGNIRIQTDQLYQAGSLLAKGKHQGGNISLRTNAYIATSQAIMDTSSPYLAGSIQIATPVSYFSSGTYRANGDKGGSISIDSNRVYFAAATLSAEGKTQGGEIAIFSRSGGHPLHINAHSSLSVKARPKYMPGTILLSSPYRVEGFGKLPQREEEGSVSISLNPIIPVAPSVSSCIQSVFRLEDPNPSSGASSFGSSIVPLPIHGRVAVAKQLDSTGGTQAGAVYLFNGATGALLSTLTGASANDHVGSGGIVALTNGNYTVISPDASSGVGAVTWRSGSVLSDASISSSNSFFGSATSDFTDVTSSALTNGNFVIALPRWDNGGTTDVGAVLWINGSTGRDANGNVGTISTANSIRGSSSGDRIGSAGIAVLTNGNCIIGSPLWNGNRGAATWMNGETGKDALGVIGAVSASNSLVGSLASDGVGTTITPLSNGHAITGSSSWNSGLGAATWMSGTDGKDALGSYGAISASDSLTGTANTDAVSLEGIVALQENGNAVILSPSWTSNRGAVTWISGTDGKDALGSYGAISASDSLTGTASSSDQVGSGGAAALSNGNAIFASPNWSSGKGAVTWISGTDGKDALDSYGAISASDSIVGENTSDNIGSGGVIAFVSNGNGAAISPEWGSQKGAVTWINGSDGTDVKQLYTTVSTSNSIVGAAAGDQVGSGGVVPLLIYGNAVISSPEWGGGLGAATWINGATGKDALGSLSVVSSANSLVGSQANDGVSFSGITTLSSGDFIVESENWDNNAIVDAGAVTFGSGETGDFCGIFGAIQTKNSALGPNASSQLTITADNPSAETYLYRFANENGSPSIFALHYFVSPNFTVAIPGESFVKYNVAITEEFARIYPCPLSGYEPPFALSPREQTVSPFSLITLKPWTPPKVTYED